MRFAPLHHHDPAAAPGPTPTGYRVTGAAVRGSVEVRPVTGFGE
ncbi:hypothetical protein AB0M72_16265 [Nocardiopsis dassonvillei]